MEQQSIADLSEQIENLLSRISDVRQKSDHPFAALVLDEVRQHIVQADDWMCRLANARTQVTPAISHATLAKLICVTHELSEGHSMAAAERARDILAAAQIESGI